MLEEAIKELTAATKLHTEALNAFLKKNGTAAPAGAAAAAGTTAAAGTKAGAKAGATTKPKGPTLEDIQTKFGAYMSVTDKAERAARKEHVLAIAGKFKAERATAIDPVHFAEALELLAQYEAGEDPFADADDGEDDGGSAI